MIDDRNIPNSSRRSGGCKARRSLRAAPLARDLRRVRRAGPVNRCLRADAAIL